MEEIIFPNQIRMFRRVHGIPMKKIADHLGISLSAVSKIERGYRRIDEKQLAAISELLNCPPEAIFVTEESSQPEVIKAWKVEQERRNKINSGSGLKTLGAGLRYLRGQKKLTLLQVSKGAGLTLAVYHRIEMGQREVEEPVLERIAHAIGYSGSDLQLKIYELDISGALDELKQSDNKSGIKNSKGGYNDLPVSRFMIKATNAQEINVPIYGLPQEDGTIILDKEKSSGSILCPSTLANIPDVYGIRLLTKTLGTILPQRSILVVAPGQKLKDGDIAVLPIENNRVKLVSVYLSAEGTWSYTSADTNGTTPISFDILSKMQRIVFIAIP